jgi:hypothetical protein
MTQEHLASFADENVPPKVNSGVLRLRRKKRLLCLGLVGGEIILHSRSIVFFFNNALIQLKKFKVT